MTETSGNEDLRRPHEWSGLLFWLWMLAGSAILIWVNLARAAAMFRPWWGGTGPLGVAATALARPREVGLWFSTVVWDGLIGVKPLLWLAWTTVGRALGRPPSESLWTWMYYTGYLFTHGVGAPAHSLGGFAAGVLVVAWNSALFGACVWLPAFMVTRRMASARAFDARLGTAHWPAPRILRPYTRAVGTRGALPLGRIAQTRPGAGTAIALPLRDPRVNVGRNSHALVVAVSEAGKTSGIFKPWAFSDLFMNDPTQVDPEGWPVGAMSSVLIDMKHSTSRPDIYGDLAPYAAVLPRRLLLLAPGDLKRSLHYNPLDFVRIDADFDPTSAVDDIGALAHAIILNTPGGERDDQWHQGVERNLLKLLIGYVCDVHQATERGVPTVRGLEEQLARFVSPVLRRGMAMPALRSFPMIAALVMLSPTKLIEVIRSTVTDQASPETWLVRCEHFTSEATRRGDLTGWFEGMQRRLEAFATPGVAAISTRSDFSLDLIGRQPTTLVIGMPRELTKELEPYSALIVTQLLQQLKRVAASSRTGRLPVGVTLYLDELPAQGRIPHLEHEIATGRDMALAFVCGMQSGAALEGRYGKVASEAIKSTTNTKIVIGRNLGLEDAEYFSRRAGETTILTAGAMEGARGAGRSVHMARRPLITPDQIYRMPQYEALVFLQTGHHTQTRLRPFHETQAERAHLPTDRRFVDGESTADGVYVPPATFLRVRQAELDTLLGAWDTRPTRPTVSSVAVPNGPRESARLSGALHDLDGASAPKQPGTVRSVEGSPPPPPAGGAPAVPVVGSLTRAVANGEGQAQLPREPRTSGDATREAPQGAMPHGTADVRQADASPPSPIASNGAHEATPTLPAVDSGAISDLAGLFNTLVRGRLAIAQSDAAGTPGWWIRLPGGEHVLLRWSIVRSFAELRRTKARDLAARWERAGLVVARRLTVAAAGGEPVPVLAFTPEAVRRLTPAVTDVVGAWARLEARDIRGLELRGPAAEPAAPSPESARQTPIPSDPATSADEALQLVIAWARQHQRSLQSGSLEEGQWEAVVHGEPALLVRQPSLNRVLFGRKADVRTVLPAWRDAGVIITEEKRFTVYTRVGDAARQGERFVAFRWDRLERAGLARA